MIGANSAAEGPRGDLAGHPAVAIWSKLFGARNDPARIDVLRGGKESTTYRLVGAGPSGESIIAQRSLAARARIQRTVYEQILPHLSVTSPRYYGFRQEDRDFVWLFFEDLGDERFSKTDAAHQALAGRWVGLMHTGAARIAAARALPDGGPPRYLDHLRVGRDAIRAGLANPALTALDVTLLERFLLDLDGLEHQWAAVEQACTGLPPTLTHGDFRPKNAYVRTGATGLELFPFDWETAGWGVPAIDLTKIDLSVYWSVVRQCWRDAPIETVRRLAAVGRIFLVLAAIRWASPELAHPEAQCLLRPMAWLRSYRERLANSVRELEALT